MNKRGFASDNNAGVHPEILEALAKVNVGHTIGYGNDVYTDEAKAYIKKEFGDDTDIYLVFTGTAANVLSIKALTRSFHSVICAATAHIEEDECGAPENYTGCKLLPVETPDGKLNTDLVAKHMYGFNFEHHAQPRIISISQSTEMGTVYSLEEIAELADYAHENGLLLHMDGARIANAAVSLDCTFRQMTREAGVDVLSFGGTKNGMMCGEAVLFFNPELSEDFKYIRKQGMQLGSKMRFMSAQFVPYFTNDLWKRSAAHANAMAQLLEKEVRDIPGVEITQKVQSNGVFAIIPGQAIQPLQKEYFFYVWDESRNEVRWMTSFDTTEDDIRSFAAVLRKLV